MGLWWWLLRWVFDWVLFVGLCLWLGSRLGSIYVCVCGFVLVVGIGWVEASFGLQLLWVVIVGCGDGVGFFCRLSLGFFVAGFVGLLNFGCFYVWFWLVFEMILLQIWWIWVVLMVACEQWRWLWVVGGSGGGWGFGFACCSSESSNERGRDKCEKNNEKIIFKWIGKKKIEPLMLDVF